MSELPSVASKRLHEQVLHALVESIVTEKYAAGDSLPSEAELCEVYHVSRSSVREALRVLSEKGLIEVRHGLGTRVNPPERWDFMDPLVLSARRRNDAMGFIIGDLHEARTIVESEIASLAAQRATSEDRKRMNDSLERMRQSSGDPVAFSEEVYSFHHAMIEAAGNRVLLRMAASIRELLLYTIQLTATLPDAFTATLDEHQAIYHAICASDAGAAGRAMREHLERARREIARLTPSRN
jgi:DNA-binding FadR family transcriptional regulator